MHPLARWALLLRRDVLTLWFAMRHPLTPWPAKALAVLATAYALSPIDLIPDFIPVLGQLDDLILIPAAVWVLLRLIPPPVLAESRAAAERWLGAENRKPKSRLGLFLVVGVWLIAAALVLHWVLG